MVRLVTVILHYVDHTGSLRRLAAFSLPKKGYDSYIFQIVLSKFNFSGDNRDSGFSFIWGSILH